MAGYAFTITPDGGSAQVFAQVVSGSGTFALDCQVGPPIREILRFHPKGVKGNITIRDEASGQVFVCKGLLVGVLATVWAQMRDLFLAWRASPVTLIDVGGLTWTKLNLISSKMVRLEADGTSDVGGNVEIEIEMSFTKDAAFA